MARARLGDFYGSIDLRSLALFRILLAALLIYDWWVRWPNLEAFYTDFGVLPSDAPIARGGEPFHFSLLDPLTSLGAVRAFFVAGLFGYAALLVGWRSRLATLWSFLFFASVVNRTVIIRQGGDVVTVTMLLWCLFLPVGAWFSLDARRRGRPPSARSPRSLAAFAVVLQIALVYLGSAFTKSGDAWKDGSAVHYALAIDQMVTPFGAWLAERPPELLRALTWSTLAIEWLAAPTMLSPFLQPALRRLAIVLLAGMHLDTAAALDLGSFPFVMIATFALLLGDADWRRLGVAGGEAPSEPPPRDGRAAALADAAVAVVLASVLAYTFNANFAAGLGAPRIPLPRGMEAVIQGPQLVHHWNFFAPYPIRDDGWWVVDAITASRRRVDPLTGAAPTFQKPADLAARVDVAWRKYLYRIWHRRYRAHRAYFAAYLARRWAREHPDDPLTQVHVFYVLETTQGPEARRPYATRLVRLVSLDCTSDSRCSEGVGKGDGPLFAPSRD